MLAVAGVCGIGAGGLAGDCLSGVAVLETRPLLALLACAPTAGTRFRLLMTVFFMATGRGTPCSLWYRPNISRYSSNLLSYLPHALH